jgi:hypothetical protein
MEELGNVLESILMWAKIAGICGLIAVGLFVFGHWGNSAAVDASETQHEDAGPELQQTKSAAPLQAPEPAEANDQPPPQSQSAMDASIAEVLRAQPAPAQPAPVVSVEPVAAVPSSEPPCVAPLENEVPAHRKHHGLRRFFGAIGHGFKVFGKGLVGR